jgi:hypothetical protein
MDSAVFLRIESLAASLGTISEACIIDYSVIPWSGRSTDLSTDISQSVFLIASMNSAAKRFTVMQRLTIVTRRQGAEIPTGFIVLVNFVKPAQQLAN